MKNQLRKLIGALGCEEEAQCLAAGLRKEPAKYLRCTAHRILHPKTIRHTLQITSCGGAGTTFLYDFARSMNLDIYSPYDGGSWRFDFGPWKHMRNPITRDSVPRLETKPDYRVIYLVSNPYNSVYSLFRRNFNYWAPERLQVPINQREGFDRTWDIDTYLRQECDFFQLKDHVMNWTKRPQDRDYPIMVIKYERVADHKNELLEFMRVPREKVHLFPEIKLRESSFMSLSSESRKNFEKIYGRLADYIDGLPDCFIR